MESALKVKPILWKIQEIEIQLGFEGINGIPTFMPISKYLWEYLIFYGIFIQNHCKKSKIEIKAHTNGITETNIKNRSLHLKKTIKAVIVLWFGSSTMHPFASVPSCDVSALRASLTCTNTVRDMPECQSIFFILHSFITNVGSFEPLVDVSLITRFVWCKSSNSWRWRQLFNECRQYAFPYYFFLLLKRNSLLLKKLYLVRVIV